MTQVNPRLFCFVFGCLVDCLRITQNEEEEIDEEKQVMELLEKIKDSSNGPEFVDRRVSHQNPNLSTRGRSAA